MAAKALSRSKLLLEDAVKVHCVASYTIVILNGERLLGRYRWRGFFRPLHRNLFQVGIYVSDLLQRIKVVIVFKNELQFMPLQVKPRRLDTL